MDQVRPPVIPLLELRFQHFIEASPSPSTTGGATTLLLELRFQHFIEATIAVDRHRDHERLLELRFQHFIEARRTDATACTWPAVAGTSFPALH